MPQVCILQKKSHSKKKSVFDKRGWKGKSVEIWRRKDKEESSCPPVTKSCSASQQVSKAIMIFFSPLCFDLHLTTTRQGKNCKKGDRLLGCHQGETNTFWKHTVTYIWEVSAHMRARLCMGACWISLLNQPPWVLIPLEDVEMYHILLQQVKTQLKCPVCVFHIQPRTIGQIRLGDRARK